MAFYEHRLPVEMSRMVSGGLGFRTLVNESDSGVETRIIKFTRVRGRWDLASRLMRIRENNPVLRTDIETIQSLHAAQEGRAHGFRFRHEGDFEIGDPSSPTTDNQSIGTGDGVETQFQTIKSYTFGSVTYNRTIFKLVSGTYTVLIDNVPQTEGGGSDYTIDINTGVVTFNVAPAAAEDVQIATEYDVPVRFDIDLLDIDYELARLGEIPAIPIVELKLPLNL